MLCDLNTTAEILPVEPTGRDLEQTAGGGGRDTLAKPALRSAASLARSCSR
jgi:hypothetical protein